ncbi:hypothetical protein PspCFBP13508_13340 [Pseudomonas sp. CFBP13508]|nr:hypothetical protein PspCFBP13508_13340 [Pseudomonas sp. CFBP13508]
MCGWLSRRSPPRPGLPPAGINLKRSTCGSEPARESGVSDTRLLSDTLHSRAGSLPQGFVFGFKS